MVYFIIVFRCILIFSFISFFLLTSLLNKMLSKKMRMNLYSFYSKILVFILGCKIEIKGNKNNYKLTNCMLISNHVSWLDVPVLHSVFHVRFLARQSLNKFPVVGYIIRLSNSIFVETNFKKRFHQINRISVLLKNNDVVGLFPEGRTSNGKSLLFFHNTYFESAIKAKSFVVPVALRYYDKKNKLTTEITYADDISFLKCFFNILKLNGCRVKIFILPKVKASDFINREELCLYIHKEISKIVTVAA
jgi:1-acyl-sn-glycerol-3-phosphate acyltransferase